MKYDRINGRTKQKDMFEDGQQYTITAMLYSDKILAKIVYMRKTETDLGGYKFSRFLFNNNDNFNTRNLV